MPVSVVVPIRVRLDHAVIAAEPDALGEAIAEATKRALANVRRAVFEPRGGYARPRLGIPDITVYGEAAGLLGADDLSSLTAQIEGAIATAAVATGLARPLWDPASAPEVLQVGEVVPYDPRSDLVSTYLVDSYGGKAQKPKTVPVGKGGRKPAAKPEALALRLLECQNTPDALLAAGNGLVEATVREFLAVEYTDFAPIGIQFRLPGTTTTALSVLNVKLTAEGLQHSGRILLSQGLAPVTAEFHHGKWNPKQSSPNIARLLVLKKVSAQPLADRESLIAGIAEFYQREKESDREFKSLEANNRTRAGRQAIAEYSKSGEANFYREKARAMVGNVVLGPPPYRLFRIQGSFYVLAFSSDIAVDFDRLNIVPLVESVVVSGKRKGQGTGKPGGTDTGVSGGGTSKECGDQCFGYQDTATYTLDGVEPVELITGPFECEPPVSEFGPLGERMQEVMDDIAITLRMQSWKWSYVGAFLISAARVIAARSEIISSTVDIGTLEDAKPAPAGRGNVGDADVIISRSPAIQALRELAGVMPNLQYLDECAWSALGPSSSYLSECGQKRFGSSWLLHYRNEFMPAAKEAVYGIFTEACKVAMIQLLSASGVGIKWMLDNFDAYFAGIEPLLLGAVKRISELRRMRQHLLEAEAASARGMLLGGPGLAEGVADAVRRRNSNTKQRSFLDQLKASVEANATVGYQDWRSARQWWDGDMLGSLDKMSAELEAQRAVQGTIERQPDGSFAVRENRGGVDRLWTKEELERSIEMVTQIASSIDPLVKHMRNLESSVAAFQGGREPAYQYTLDLVKRMREANRDAILEAWNNRMWAFRTGKITETWKEETVPGTGVKLGNIHSMAHKAIGDAFQGSWLYPEGLKFLFGSELGRESLGTALELFATIAAFVLFAPLGVALSAGFAAHRYQVAKSHLDLVQGLIDPDSIMSFSEAELEMFMVHFETALLVIPEAGSIARQAVKGGRTLLREGFKRGSKELAEKAVQTMMKELADALKGQLLKSFVQQVVMAKALEPVLQAALAPAFKVLQQEAALGESGGGMTKEIAALAEFEAEYGDVEIELEPRQSLEDQP
jgi:hypothetical protein